MGQDLIASILALALTFSPVAPTNSATLKYPQIETVESQVREVNVKNGETLSLIAERIYEDNAYWTNIWNDNPWTSDPHYIERDWKLKVRARKGKNPEGLKPDLARKLEMQTRLAYASEAYIQGSITTNTPTIQTNTPGSIVGPLNEAQMDYLGNCESGMGPNTNTGNGFYGAFQFAQGTWNRMQTGYERADLAPLEAQKEAVQKLVSKSNIYGQFPACSRRMRALGLL